MANITGIVQQLREQRDRIDAAIAALSGNGQKVRAAGTRNRRHMSPSARARISAAQKARWAKQKAGKKSAA